MTQGFDGKYFELDYGNAEIDKISCLVGMVIFGKEPM